MGDMMNNTATAVSTDTQATQPTNATAEALKFAQHYELELVLGRGNYRRIARETGYCHQYVTRVLKGEAGLGFSFEFACVLAAKSNITLDELESYVKSKIADVERTRKRVSARESKRAKSKTKSKGGSQ